MSDLHIHRDLRLDFLRGLALIVVLIDHIEEQSNTQMIRPWTPISTSFFDGAEAFVFLSGMVFGRSFQARLNRQGYLACQTKAMGRAAQLYLTFLMTVWTLLGIGLCFSSYSLILINRLNLPEGIVNCVLWSLPMCYQPYGTSILGMYTVILPFMPLLLVLWVRHGPVAWIVSIGLYSAGQALPALQLPRFPWDRTWTFAPLAWQFLFFIGIVAGTSRIRPHAGRAGRVVLFVAATAVLVLGVLIRKNWLGLFGNGVPAQTIIQALTPWSTKSQLGPVRILHFLSFVIVLTQLLPSADAKVWRGIFAAPFVKCGQHSLAVYAFGVILTYLAMPAFAIFGESPEMVLWISLDCCVLSTCLAFGLEYRRRIHPPSKVPQVSETYPITPALETKGSTS